ncbi:isopentenyl-diphosphate Delta-isomerase [Micromonospora sp. WMMD1102]|uniref:isopentenyl-diphosphate Delta-isomerase n=1 Tax=Micromonospora sp. WMMD1102 TaxID=3016105 RepID=UPI0024151535|nr:isopentenyl-diphosphate Delta-isomerase [Micromonospora sp. WMMD1102]MDG4790695.1 isopentenyl-diphosphate Delta-isomerase [Micromonospora sp. WMMD1102]
MTADRERHLVELVDEAGTPLGARTVEEAHRPPGQLHRAFSVLLVDPEGRILLQQRAAAKTRFPLRWANACCGHPEPGQPLDVAAGRRLREELGVEAVPLTEIGVYLYRAEDPGTGRVEYEYDHVLLGDFDAARAVLPDPDEVADLRWVHPDELRAGLDADPDAYAPWLAGVLGRLTERSRSSAAGAARRAGNRGRWEQPPAPTGQEEDNPAEWSGGR